MEIVKLIAIIPFAFLLFPVHQYFVWKEHGKGLKTAEAILWVMGGLLAMQIAAATILIVNHFS